MGEEKLMEPLSHVEAKSICEKIFPKLAEGTKLSKEELEIFYNFRNELVQNYD